MSFAIWALIGGAILITMALLGTLLKRMPLSPGILYLALGYALGPAGWALMAPDGRSFTPPIWRRWRKSRCSSRCSQSD